MEWVINNEEKIDQLVLSRGGILGLSPSLVTVEISKVQAAISYLQILLVAICALLAGISWLCLLFFASSHYSSSLLANLIATTMVISDGDDTKGGKPKYLTRCPEIMLTQEKDPKAAMVTATGTFRHVSFEGPRASEHLIADNVKDHGISETGLAKTPAVSGYEVVHDVEHKK